MRWAVQSIQAEVLARPIEIGVRQVHGGGLGTDGSGINTGRAGIGEKVQEAHHRSTTGVRHQRRTLFTHVVTQPAAYRAVVQKQARIEIVREVHGELQARLGHGVELLLLPQLRVLRIGPLRAAGTEIQLPLTQAEHTRQGSQHFPATHLGTRQVDGLRWRVFLHISHRRLSAVPVDSKSVFGHIGVVDAVALHAFALGPGTALGKILPQTVRKHLRTGLLGNGSIHRWQTPGLAFAVEVFGLHLKAQQATLDRPVENGMAAPRLDTQGFAQLRVAREHASLPADIAFAQHGA